MLTFILTRRVRFFALLFVTLTGFLLGLTTLTPTTTHAATPDSVQPAKDRTLLATVQQSTDVRISRGILFDTLLNSSSRLKKTGKITPLAYKPSTCGSAISGEIVANDEGYGNAGVFVQIDSTTELLNSGSWAVTWNNYDSGVSGRIPQSAQNPFAYGVYSHKLYDAVSVPTGVARNYGVALYMSFTVYTKSGKICTSTPGNFPTDWTNVSGGAPPHFAHHS